MYTEVSKVKSVEPHIDHYSTIPFRESDFGVSFLSCVVSLFDSSCLVQCETVSATCSK